MPVSYLDTKKALLEHKDLIASKGFLKHLYIDFYNQLLGELPSRAMVVELGSGGGFIKDLNPRVITSDVIGGPGIDRIFYAESMPFKANSVDAFVMQNVLHHIKDPAQALMEMQRCLKVGGTIGMIEPYNSTWGRFVYTHFHHEVFDPTGGWKINGKGRMSAANGALPWILLERDRELFEKRHRRLAIAKLTPHTPFSYLLSGGVSHGQFLPTATYPFFHKLEQLLAPLNGVIGMFMTVKLVKTA